LRWFAAIGVVLTHFALPDAAPAWARTLGANGFLGVPFFFTLSGYVLTARYAGAWTGLTDYSRRRFWRIAPLYWIAFAAGWVLLQHSPRVDRYAVVHVLGLQAWLPNVGDVFAYNGPGWTISVEIVLYALFPALLRPVLARPSGPRDGLRYLAAGFAMALAFGGVILLLPTSDPQVASDLARWLLRLPVAHVSTFVIGMGVAMVTMPRAHRPSGALAASLQVVALGGAIVVLSTMPPRASHLSMVIVDSIGAAIGSGIVIGACAAAPSSPISRLLASRPMILLGSASYAVYLLHMPVLQALHGLTLPLQLGYPTRIAILTLFAIALHRWIEQPLYRRFAAPSARLR